MTQVKNNFWTDLVITLFAVYIPFYCFRNLWDSTPMWIFLIGWTILAIGRAYFRNLHTEDETTASKAKRTSMIFGGLMIILGIVTAIIA